MFKKIWQTKVFGILLFCIGVAIFYFPAFAMSPAFLQSVVGGDSGCDDCSGTLKFAWHMEDNDSTPDVTLGNPCGCSDGDTIGAETGSPVFSSAQKSDGTYSLHINATNEHYKFVVSSDDLIETDNVKITFDIYVVSYPVNTEQSHIFLRTAYNTPNSLFLGLKNGYVYVQYVGNSDVDYIETLVATGSWVSCEYQAKTGITGNDHYLKCGANETEEDDDLTGMVSSSVKLCIGDEYGSGAGEYYLDKVRVSTCDMY